MFINRQSLLPVSLATTFLGDNNDGDCVFIHISDYERITQRLVSDDVSLIFKMYDPKKPDVSRVVRIGGFHTDDVNVVYSPEWIINSTGFDNRVTLKQLYNVPVATKLQIQLFEEENIYGPETKELFEKSLHKYGCIELNKSINLYLDELEISVMAIVTQLEPVNEDGYARFNGEVEVDIVPLEKEIPRPQVTVPSPVIPEDSPQSEVVIPTREELRQMRLKRFQ